MGEFDRMGLAQGENAAQGGHIETDERRMAIVESVLHDGLIRVCDICRRFGVSEVTARNDLKVLARAGKLARVRGGARALRQTSVPSLSDLRANVNIQAKRQIAQRAAEFVKDGELIAVDAGTTTLEFVKALTGKRDITIVTYDLDIATYVDSSLPHAIGIMPGGVIQKNRRYLVGPMTVSDLRRFHFDRVFLGTDAFAPRHGFGTITFESVGIKECLIKQAHWHAVLMDASKVGKPRPIRFATLEDIDAIIMDSDPGGAVRLSIDALELEEYVALIADVDSCDGEWDEAAH